MGDLPFKFMLKLAKIPFYVGMTFLFINLALVLFTAIRVNTIAHTAMLVINENNFMPPFERQVIVQELANMGRNADGGTNRQSRTNAQIGVVQQPGMNVGSPIVGGWDETQTSLALLEDRVQHGVVSEFEMFVWFRPYIPVFGNLFVRPYDNLIGAPTADGDQAFNRFMLDTYGVVGGQTGTIGGQNAGAAFDMTNSDQGMFSVDGGWNWANPAGGGGAGVGLGLQGHLDAERSWFDFRIGGCYRAVGLHYYPDLLFNQRERGGCPAYGIPVR